MAIDFRVPDRDAVSSAAEVIRSHIRETPILRVAAADFGLAGRPLTFKLEYLQHAGTFKARGAFANMLMREDASGTVVAASGGNHGAAVAYAARALGRTARIYVPALAPPAKIERIRSYDAEVVVGGDRYVDALKASEDWLARNGGMAIHAYDQFETLAGQGTVGLELSGQAPELDTALVGVGGGGLIGGIAAHYAGAVKVIGVEPELCPTLTRAMEVGAPAEVSVGGIAADSLGASRIGSLAFAVAQTYVGGTILISDAEILAAQRALWDVLRVLVEPGGAAAFAALLSGRYRPAGGERVGIILCGANTGALPSPKPTN